MRAISSKRFVKLLGAAFLATATLVPGCGRNATTGRDVKGVVQHASRKTLKPFESEKDLSAFLKELSDAQTRQREEQTKAMESQSGTAQPSASAAAEPPSQAPADDGGGGEESVTNTQHAGVDEGGIVKVHGEHLVVLRRGRLFTVKISGGDLTPVSSVDAFGRDVDPSGTWYDEMLVAKDTIAVIGYSYSRGGTEIGLFDISSGGKLAYRSTYHLRSNDYYSSRNYASRLIGDKLVFYTPLYLSVDEKDPFRSFPALRKWHKGAKDDEFRRIASATRVYRPILASTSLTLHTVTMCDLGKRELDCEATAVLGPAGRVFYVSPSSVFVWMTDYENVGERPVQQSLVYRLPLDGSGPSALRVSGAPVDQFSFLESKDGHLNVLVRADSAGDAMWAAEKTDGAVALLRVRLESFSDGVDRAPASAYRDLPKPVGYTFQNRFVADYLLYGTGSGWGDPEVSKNGSVFAYRYAGGRPVTLRVGHGVDRIEALGENAIVVGTDGKDLHFTPVALGDKPKLAKRYTRKDAAQGELRSHGFFYKPSGDGKGLLGLPVREAGRPGYEHLFNDSASVLFLANDRLALGELGTLGAKPETAADDGCRASCVDWYGNARPLFLQKRLFALLGYEIVEGSLDEGRIHEIRRTSFAPRTPKIAR
jgi:hypothetical protein